MFASNRIAMAALLCVGLLAAHSQGALVAYYNYDNIGNLGQDSSGMGNHLVALGAPAAGAGQFAGGLELNGAGSALVPAGPFPAGVPTGASSYTTASWTNADVGGARGIVAWGNYGAGNQVNALRIGGTTEIHNYWWANDAVVTGLPDLTAGSIPAGWNHVAASWNNTATSQVQRIYLNGKQVGVFNRTGLNAQASNFAVGRSCTFCGGGEFWDGQLDDTAIYNNALSPNQVVALGTGAAQPNALPAASPLVGLYRFENGGNIGQDTSGVLNNLAANGNATQTGAGKYGAGLMLDGNGDFLSSAAFPTGVPVFNEGYAVAGWFKPAAPTNGIGQQNGIIGWGNYGAGNQVTALRLASDVFGGGQGFRHYWWGNDQDLSSGAVNLFDGQYHHVVATYDPATNMRSIYLDGVLLGSGSPGAHNAQPVNFTVGRTASGVFGLDEWFNGMLDDVAIFNRALTQQEINAILAGDFSAFLPAQQQAVPEPASALLGLLGLAALARRRRVKA